MTYCHSPYVQVIRPRPFLVINPRQHKPHRHMYMSVETAQLVIEEIWKKSLLHLGFVWQSGSSLLVLSAVWCLQKNAAVTVERGFLNYIIKSVLRAFWLVLSYDLIEDRRKDDDSARSKSVWQLRAFSEPIRMRWFVKQPMNLLRFIETIDDVKCLFSRVCKNGERFRSTRFWWKQTNFASFVS